MKATKLIRDKGLQYAKEIVDSAPDNATDGTRVMSSNVVKV